MKLFSISFLVFALTCVFLINHARAAEQLNPNPQQTTDQLGKKENRETAKDQTPSPSLFTQLKQSGSEKNWLDWYAAFGPSTWANWAVAFLAMVAGVAGFYNLWLIRRQVDLGNKSASAAIKSAEVAEMALHINRPFVLVMGIDSFQSRTLIKASPIFRNYGSGPADIIEYTVYMGLYEFARGQYGLEPWPPDYTDMIRMTGDPIIPPNSETHETMVIQVPLSDEDHQSLGDITPPPAKQIAIHGRIRYRGTARQEYTTRFFWWYDISRRTWARGLRKGLNEHD